jgi:acyl-coenzyme A synthetase/AMP-(fatty) acid ligase
LISIEPTEINRNADSARILVELRTREIEFIDELPKTVSGKIRRVELRRQEESRKGKSV